MKHTKPMAVVTLFLMVAGGASAQSLGEAARAARKNKPETNPSRHYDNDNLPTGAELSVVGPPATDTSAGSANSNQAPKAADAAPAAPSSERQKAADEWKMKIEAQKQKVDSLNHEVDLGQRELRLRTAALSADPGVRLRNPTQWDKDEAQYRSQMEEKQKALDTARKELDDVQEQAHKAGIDPGEKSDDSNKGK